MLPEFFKETYKTITQGNELWNSLPAGEGELYSWDPTSTYVHDPPYFKGMPQEAPGGKGIKGASVLLNLGDSITTDHISPAGNERLTETVDY